MSRLLRPLPLLVALALAFFGPLLFCAAHYPGGYDWRHTVMSSLASPRQDPACYRVASWGMAASGVLLSLLGFLIRQKLHVFAPSWSAWACVFFVLGGILLTASALVTPGHDALFGLSRAHAKIAQASGVAFGLSMALDLRALVRLPPRRAWVRVSAIFLVAAPMTAFLLCRIFLPWIEASAPPAERSAIHHSIAGSLAFWDWIGSVTVYAFVSIVVLAPRDDPAGAATRARPVHH